MIAKFENHEVMTKPKEAIEVLKDMENTYNEVKKNINGIEAKEKEMSSLIQSIINHQKNNNDQIGELRKKINGVQVILNSTRAQIGTTQNQLARLNMEIVKLNQEIRQAESRVRRRRRQRNRWIIGAILTGGLLTVAAVAANKALNGARQDVRNRQAMMRDAETRTLAQNNAEMTKLTGEVTQKQYELKRLEELLRSLRPAQQDTLKYREYLLALSDAFNQLNIYAQNLHKNLNVIVETQAAGVAPDQTMKSAVDTSCKNLKDSWLQTKSSFVMQKVLNLTNPNDVMATLSAIKSEPMIRRGLKIATAPLQFN